MGVGVVAMVGWVQVLESAGIGARSTVAVGVASSAQGTGDVVEMVQYYATMGRGSLLRCVVRSHAHICSVRIQTGFDCQLAGSESIKIGACRLLLQRFTCTLKGNWWLSVQGSACS